LPSAGAERDHSGVLALLLSVWVVGRVGRGATFATSAGLGFETLHTASPPRRCGSG
jgi:hypothetical protein